MARRASARIAMIVAVVIGIAFVVPAAATAAPTAPHTLFSFAGTSTADYITKGVQRFFDSDVDDVTTSASPTQIQVTVQDSYGAGGPYELSVYAPTGQTFTKGRYGDHDLAEADNGLATISFSGDGRGCDGGGNVTVLDIASAGNAVTRLDMLYEFRCDGDSAGTFGELRYNEPNTVAAELSASTLALPAVALGRATAPVYLWLENTADTGTSIVVNRTDDGAQGFAVNPGTCGFALDAHTRCALSVTFTALQPGTVTASYTVNFGTQQLTVTIVGTTGPGTTAVQFVSNPGDPIGGGTGAYFYDASTADLQVQGDGASVGAQIFGPGGPWDLQLNSTDLEPGTYSIAGAPGSPVAFSFSGRGYACGPGASGTVVIRQVEVTAVSKSIGRLDLTFSQTCKGASGALTGRIAFNATSLAERTVRATRVLDTRIGLGGPKGQIPAGGRITTSFAAQTDLGANGVDGASFNLTVVGATRPGFVSITPGSVVGATSNINFGPISAQANAAVVALGPSRTVTIYNSSSAPVDVLLDLQAVMIAQVSARSGAVLPQPAQRLADTRIGGNLPRTPVPAGGSIVLDVSGVATGPGLGVTGVLVNLLAVNASAAGFLAAYADGTTRSSYDPSALNYAAGVSTAGLAVAPVGTDGKIRILNGSTQPVNIVVDLQGYYTGTIQNDATGLTSVESPAYRAMDTRSGVGAPRSPVPPGGSVYLRLESSSFAPASVIITVTIVGATQHGYAAVDVTGQPVSTTSVVNFVPGRNSSNLVVSQLGEGSATIPGGLAITNHSAGPISVIIDFDGAIYP